REKATGALPLPIPEAHDVTVVIGSESSRESLDVETVGLFGVEVCLLDLSDEAGVHCSSYLGLGQQNTPTRTLTRWRLDFVASDASSRSTLITDAPCVIAPRDPPPSQREPVWLRGV